MCRSQYLMRLDLRDLREILEWKTPVQLIFRPSFFGNVALEVASCRTVENVDY